MGKKKSTFKCAWCGENEIKTPEAHKIIESDNLTCPKCGKFSYCNSITTPYKIETKNWKVMFGTTVK